MIVEAKNQLAQMFFHNDAPLRVPFLVIATAVIKREWFRGMEYYNQVVVVSGLAQERFRGQTEALLVKPLEFADRVVIEVFRRNAARDERQVLAYCEGRLLADDEDITASDEGRKIIERWENEPLPKVLFCPKCKEPTSFLKEKRDRWEAFCPDCKITFERHYRFK
jgi:hypothetical protein